MPPDAYQRLAAQAVAAGLLATIAFVAFLLLRRTQVELAVHLYVVTVGALSGAVLAARAMRRVRLADRPSLVDRIRRRRRRPRPDRVRSLEELEHAVDFSTTTAFDVHFRLRPHLVRIARHRLSAHHGILLEADPDAARRLLGAEAWDLVRPDREPPAERNARGVPLARLLGVVDALEEL